MECKIKKGTIGKEGKIFYLCTTHKQFLNEEPTSTCGYDSIETFDKENVWKKEDISTIEFIFSIPYNSSNCKIILNGKEVSALFIEESKIIKDDFFGLYTSLKNDIELEKVRCTECNHLHSDDGIFATKPHDAHLCYYCGSLFKVSHQNIGNELYSILNIPKLTNRIEEQEGITYKYDLLKGTVEPY